MNHLLIMKKRLILFTALLAVCVTSIFAQESGAVDNPETGVSVATFAGVTMLVSLLGTQLAKRVPYISQHTWCKILVSIALGMAVAMVSWALGLADFMAGFEWWHALLTGVASGLSACGFYDLVKAVAGLFKKNDE